MVNVSIKDFIQSGQFGPIELGISRDSLRTLLGYPDDYGVYPKSVDVASIWRYGDIEFYFDNANILHMIFADNFDTPHGGEKILLDPWVTRMHVDDSTFQDALNAIGVEYTIETVPHLPGHINIKTSGGVEFLFQIQAEDRCDRLGLYGFWLRQNAVQ